MLEDGQLSNMFKRKKLIDDETLEKAKAICEESGRTLYDVLLKDDLVDEEKAIIAVSKHLNLPCVSLREYNANQRILELIPQDLAEKYHVMPLGLTEEDGERKLFVAMANPLDIDAIEDVSDVSGFSVSPLLAGPNDITSAVTRSYAAASEGSADGGGLEDGLGEMLDGLFEGGVDAFLGEDGEGGEEPSDKTPAKPAGAARLKAKKPGGLGFSLDFGDLGLSVSPDKPKSIKDVHSRRTLPAGTELPTPGTGGHDFTRTPTAVRDKDEALEALKEAEAEAEAEPKGGAAESDGEDAMVLDLGDDWGDLGDFDLDDDPREASSPSSSRPGRTENSTIRYVADKSLKSPARSGFPYNVPSADLARATVQLLIKKGIITEAEVREQLKKMRG